MQRVCWVQDAFQPVAMQDTVGIASASASFGTSDAAAEGWYSVISTYVVIYKRPQVVQII